MILRRLACAALWLGLLLPLPARAQAPRLTIERLGFDRPPQLKVYLNFIEGDGSSLVHNKKAEDFRLQVDRKDQGKPVALTIFERAREPIYVVAVVQLTPAMEPALEEVRKGMRVLADAVARVPESRMSLLGYSEDVKRLVDGGTASEIGEAVRKLKIDPDATEAHMLDALRIGVDILRGHDKGRRKLLVLFSDGVDVKNEKKAFDDVADKAADDGVVIDSVGYAPFEQGRLRSLIELSKATRGTARGAKTVDEIGKRFTSVAAEVLRQYVGLWDIKPKGDGKPHTFQVTGKVEGKPPTVPSEERKEVLPEGIGGKKGLGLGGCSCRMVP